MRKWSKWHLEKCKVMNWQIVIAILQMLYCLCSPPKSKGKLGLWFVLETLSCLICHKTKYKAGLKFLVWARLRRTPTEMSMAAKKIPYSNFLDMKYEMVYLLLFLSFCLADIKQLKSPLVRTLQWPTTSVENLYRTGHLSKGGLSRWASSRSC